MKVVTVGTGALGGINSVISNLSDDGLYDDKENIRIVTHLGKNKIQDLFLFVSSLVKIFYLSATNNNLIFHSHMSYNGSFWRKFLFFRIARFFKHKTILHLHGSEFAVYFNASSKFTKNCIKKLFLNVEEVVVLSSSWSDFVTEVTNRKPLIIRNYANVQYSKENRSPTDLLFLGAFIERKGIYDLLQSLSRLDSDVHLHLCGDGQLKTVKSLCNELGIAEQVTIHGWVNSETKFRLLNRCAALILPTYNEGLPMVLIEAMGCKIPIVTTPVGGIPEVIKDGVNGNLIEPGDVIALTAIVRKIINAPQSQQELVSNASEYYWQNFHSQVAIPQWDSLYHSLFVDSNSTQLR